MEAYSNCRQFNCVPPIVEQAEYHMFCREKCELYIPDLSHKIGVGLMAWGPLSMALTDSQNTERFLYAKNSFKTKTHSYSWTEDEINKNVSRRWLYTYPLNLQMLIELLFRPIISNSTGQKSELMSRASKAISFAIYACWLRNLDAHQPNYRLHGR